MPVSAGTYLHQGDKVYYGDRVDLTGVYGWQCTVARWAPGTSDLQPPSQIRDVCSFSENIEITPDRFPTGNWYKWDGAIKKGENDLAFRVEGYRPTTPTPTVAVNITSTPTVSLTSVLPTATEVLQPTPIAIKTTPTSVVAAAQEVFLPTATQSDAPRDFIPPNLPPLPIIIIFVILLGLLVYWFLKGTI